MLADIQASFIHASSSIWVTSCNHEISLWESWSPHHQANVCEITQAKHRGAQAATTCANCVKLLQFVPKFDKSELNVCDGNMREIKTGDVLISGAQERRENLSATTHTFTQGRHTHTY